MSSVLVISSGMVYMGTSGHMMMTIRKLQIIVLESRDWAVILNSACKKQSLLCDQVLALGSGCY